MASLTAIHRPLQARQPVIRERDERGEEESDLRKACAEFESIFVQYMLQSARKALPEEGVFGNRHESRIYKSMMDEQVARAVSKGRGVGLGELLYNKLRKGEQKASVDISE